MPTKPNFETLQLHAGQNTDPYTQSRVVPIYQTAAFGFKSAEHASNLFNLKETGNIYSRIMNPTTDVFEKRIATLEGGIGALATSSGLSAQFIALTNIVNVGENLISTPYIFGGTYNQFKVSFKRLGIEARFTEDDNPESFESLIDDKTRALYLETIGNPSLNIPDFEKIATLAKKYNIPLVVDNTFGAGGYLFRPIEHGADIVVASATKWISGHGNSIGGVIIDAGNFNWGNGKFPQFTKPSEAYHGLKFWDNYGPSSSHGNTAFIVRARMEGMRDYGPTLSPFNSFLMLQGLETLSLRMERHIENTLKLAQYLSQNDHVASVNYPGLKGSTSYEMFKKYFKKGGGGVLTFVIKGGKESAFIFINALKLISHSASVGDSKTLAIHPAHTTQDQLTTSEQVSTGVTNGLIRISVGIEHIDDIIDDMEQAFEYSTK